jgi:hypothetical protein
MFWTNAAFNVTMAAFNVTMAASRDDVKLEREKG